ncbi:MAG: branched-chain amino acid transport system permease protein, partial [Solirubrobacteraceae bacterium]|nr:branched-chain amino acid transport system permease protein [Solirubrobacteraceae bacterium]
VAVGLGRRVVLTGAGVAIAALLLGYLVPSFVPDQYYMGIVVDGVVLGILAIGIGFLAHRCGLISLGHTAFYGFSAYALAAATTHWGWGPTQAVVFSLIGGTLLAVAIGALVIRTPGMGFLMLTLAFGQALYALSIQTSMRNVTGAFDGLPVTYGADQTFLGLSAAELGAADTFWPIAWTCLVLVAFGLWIVGRSRFGIVLEAIRENEERARFSGFNTYLPRLAAFAISGGCASLAGVLFALRANFVSPDTLNFVTAGDSLVAAIVGGFAVLIGPVVGGLLYIYAQGQFSDGGNLQLYTGAALILVVVFLPGGVTGFAVRQFSRVASRLPSRKRRSKS